MTRGLAHVGIAVPSIDGVLDAYARLGFALQHREELPRRAVRVAFLALGRDRVELLEPTGEGPVARFLARRGPGLHHLALECGGIEADLVRFQADGGAVIDGTPRRGAEGCMVAFLDPGSTGGVLVELVEAVDR